MEKFKFLDIQKGFDLLKDLKYIEPNGKWDNFYTFIQQKDSE